MADLGTINHTNVNAGTVPETSSAEVRGVSQALGVAKTVIDEGVKAKVTGDMLDSIAAAEESSTVEKPAPIVGPLAPEAYLTERIDRLNAVIEQGRTSQRVLAENQIKSILASAQVKYPWLYRDLQARASAVVSGSAQLAEIGLEDDVRSANAKAAQGEFDDIMKHAHDNLYIDPALSPLDSRFIQQYTDRQELFNNIEMSKMTAGAIVAGSVDRILNDPVMFHKTKDMLIGARGAIMSSVQGLSVKYRFDQIRHEMSLGEAGNQEAIDFWLNSKAAKEFLEELEADRTAYMELADWAVPEEIREDPRGAELYKYRQDGLEMYDRMISLYKEALESVPDAAQRLDAFMSVRQLDTFSRLSEPSKTAWATLLSEDGQALFDLAKDAANPEGMVLADNLSLAGQSVLREAFPVVLGGTGSDDRASATGAAIAQGLHSTAALQIPEGVNHQDILDIIGERLADSKNSWLIPVNGVEDELVASLRNRDVNMGFWKAAANVVDKGNPAFADNRLLGITYSMEYDNKIRRLPQNLVDDQLRFLSDGSLNNAVDRSLEGGASAKRNAFGFSAQEFYNKSQPDRARADAKSTFFGKDLGAGVSLDDVVRLDMDAIREGRFAYTIDKEALKPLATHLGARSMGMFSQAQPQRAQDMVHTEMGKIVAVMEQQIAIERLINKAKSRDGTIFAQPDTWQAFFLGEGAPDPGNAWANVFLGN